MYHHLYPRPPTFNQISSLGILPWCQNRVLFLIARYQLPIWYRKGVGSYLSCWSSKASTLPHKEETYTYIHIHIHIHIRCCPNFLSTSTSFLQKKRKNTNLSNKVVLHKLLCSGAHLSFAGKGNTPFAKPPISRYGSVLTKIIICCIQLWSSSDLSQLCPRDAEVCLQCKNLLFWHLYLEPTFVQLRKDLLTFHGSTSLDFLL